MQYKIEQTIQDYKKRAETAQEFFDNSTNSGSQHDMEKFSRIKTKISLYKEFASELEALLPKQPLIDRHYMIGSIGRFVRHQGGIVTSKDMELDISPCISSTNQTQILVDTIHENSVEVSTMVADQLEAIDDMDWEELSDEIIEEIYNNLVEYGEQIEVQEQKDRKNGVG
jgi:hypothetical protein